MNKLIDQLISQLLDQYHLAFVAIGTIEEEDSISLIESLTSIPPLLDRELLASTVADGNSYLNLEVAEDLIQLLFSVYNLFEKSDFSIDEITDRVAQSINEDEQISLVLSREQSKKVSSRLKCLLEEDGTIATSYKAMVILKDHKCVFSGCRVFTDIRPIFGVDTAATPVGMGIIHMLKIMYVGLDGPNELFVGLDSSDLEQLGDEVERAVTKETSILSMFEKVDIHCL